MMPCPTPGLRASPSSHRTSTPSSLRRFFPRLWRDRWISRTQQPEPEFSLDELEELLAACPIQPIVPDESISPEYSSSSNDPECSCDNLPSGAATPACGLHTSHAGGVRKAPRSLSSVRVHHHDHEHRVSEDAKVSLLFFFCQASDSVSCTSIIRCHWLFIRSGCLSSTRSASATSCPRRWWPLCTRRDAAVRPVTRLDIIHYLTPHAESNRKFQRISRSRKAHKTAQDVESEDEDDGSYTLSTEELVNLLQERFGHL